MAKVRAHAGAMTNGQTGLAPEHVGVYSSVYLNQYWPEEPTDAVAWGDNVALMLAYQEAALAARRFLGRTGRMLDISTGPALAPLLAALTLVSDVQLSDFEEDNRRALREMPITYWRNYVPMLTSIYDHPERMQEFILAQLDRLRLSRPIVPVDIFLDPPFGQEIEPHSFDIISMQFVADSVAEDLPSYLRCLGRVTDMVRPGAVLLMSAIVDSLGWQMGAALQPSPNVTEKTVLDFLKSQGLTLLSLRRSMRFKSLSYSGGWIVLAAARG